MELVRIMLLNPHLPEAEDAPLVVAGLGLEVEGGEEGEELAEGEVGNRNRNSLLERVLAEVLLADRGVRVREVKGEDLEMKEMR